MFQYNIKANFLLFVFHLSLLVIFVFLLGICLLSYYSIYAIIAYLFFLGTILSTHLHNFHLLILRTLFKFTINFVPILDNVSTYALYTSMGYFIDYLAAVNLTT